MIFDVTKVTYNMYSCSISFMSREMMEMDGRDSHKCQKSKLGDIDDIFGIVLSDNRTKGNSVISFIRKTKTKNVLEEELLTVAMDLEF